MRISKLIEHLEALKGKYGDLEIDLITEIDAQVEQPLGDIAVAPGRKTQNGNREEARLKLLPEGF